MTGTAFSRNIIGILRVLWVILVVGLAVSSGFTESKCQFEAIFNFGDSNSDTGGFWAAFPAQSGPWGMTYFKRPAGRASDGRLTIDFLAQALGLPFLSPYLQSIGSNYKHGANYATLASTVFLPNTSLFVTGISPFSLAIQLNQMKAFKAKVDEHHASHRKESEILPTPDIFGKSLYTIYIGQNDFTSNLRDIGVEGVKKYLPQVVDQISYAIKELYGLGGRAIMVLNLAPVGCYPALLAELPYGASDVDDYDCIMSVNKAVVYYNRLLKRTLDGTRAQLHDVNLVYVDSHRVLLELFRHPKSYGFEHGIRACCGHGGGKYNFDPELFCGSTKALGKGTTVTAHACRNPETYVSWDGIHASEATNKLLAMAILNGSLSHPPFALRHLCSLEPIV